MTPCFQAGLARAHARVRAALTGRVPNLIARLVAGLIVALIVAGGGSGPALAQTAQPVAKAGTLSAPGWDFTANKPLDLVGEWEVIWGALVPPDQFDARYQGDLFTLPARWNGVGKPGMNGAFGAATFRLRLRVPDYNRDVAFNMIAAHSAYRVFVDSVPVVENGLVAARPEESRANYVSRIFDAKPGDSEIVLHVSNFNHAFGGPGHPLALWDAQDLQRFLSMMSLLYGLILGVMAMIGLFHLILFIADRRDWPNASVHFWFTLLCFIIVYRVQGVIPFFHTYYPEGAQWSDLRLTYASLYAAPATYLLFFRALFPDQFPRRLNLALVGVCLGFLCVTLVAPDRVYTAIRNPAIGLNLIVIVYSLVFTIMAALKRVRGARVIVGTNAVFLATALNDAIIYTDQARGFDLTPFGILVLGLGYSYALLLRLQDRFNQARTTSAALEKLNVELEDEVAERTRAYEAAAAKAENSADERARFIAAASHDLRQPLHALALFNAALKRKLAGSPQADLLDKQEAAIANLGTLLQDTLDTTRIDVNHKTPEIAPLDLADLRDRLLGAFGPRAEDRRLALVIDAPAGQLSSDATMALRILSNLLDNAIKAARSTVRLAITPAPSGWCFSVTDDGAGFEMNRAGRIFETYTRLEDQHDTVGGYGLGLYVVRAFTAALGGTVDVSSIPGQGSTFTVTLPDLDHASDPAAVAVAIDEAPALEARPAILAIDDDAVILDALSLMLGEWGARVRTAPGPDAARHILDEGFVPDLLLVDYHLHDGTGIDAVADLRARLGDDVPAIIVTGATQQSLLQTIRAAGFPVVTKPARPTQIIDAVTRAWRAPHAITPARP